MSAAVYRTTNSKVKTNWKMKTRRGVGDDGRPSPAEARRSWGEDSFLSPNRCPARAPAPQSGKSEDEQDT